MKTIVIATDGSPSALEAVEYGLDLASDQEAEPIFVHVAPATDVLPVTGFGMGAPASVPHHARRARPRSARRRSRNRGDEGAKGEGQAPRRAMPPTQSSPTRTPSTPI